MFRIFLRVLVCVGLVAVASSAFPQDLMSIPKVGLEFGPGGGKNNIATSLQILTLLTVLSLAPAILMLTTAFTRIVIVLSFVRTALGTPSIPPNQVLVGLSLFLTAYVMTPTYEQLNKVAIEPAMAGKMDTKQFVAAATPPIRDFMLRCTYQSDLRMFLDLRKENPRDASELKLTTLIPAFIISELKTAFIIGFYIFIPFLVIDLIVASGLMSMGMMMLPPVVVSLPAKILVFVLADGWSNLVSAILGGYR